MDLLTDPGSPHLRSDGQRPPTESEWALFRLFLSYAYIKKHQPARLILKELSDRGFNVR